MASITELFSELQRRSVIRAAIVHVLFFWIVVQVADVALPYVGIVDRPVRWAVLLAVGLFPATLVVAWFLEHPWTHVTRGRVATDVLVLLIITAVAGSWVFRSLPGVMHSKTSIVILPFSHSGDRTEASLSLALATEINSLLMKSRSIDVIGIESAMSPVLQGLDAPAIAERLDVQNVLAGTIGTQGNTVRIDLSLSDRGGEAIWNSVIEDNVENLFSIQEDIAASVESLLGASDGAIPVKKVAADRCWMPNNPEAIEKFYTARYYIELRTFSNEARQRIAEAIQLYEELIDTYPKFAEAHSG